MNKGYTLIETLVVVVVFAVISLVASETILLSLRGTKKADSISKVRLDLDYATGVIQRQLRGAKSVTSTCDGTSSQEVDYTDQNNNPASFSCVGTNPDGSPSYVASSSAIPLTTSNITISTCTFTCKPATGTTPQTVTVQVTGSDTIGQNTPVSVTTQITLRSY